MSAPLDGYVRDESQDGYCVMDESGRIVWPTDLNSPPTRQEAELAAALIPGATVEKFKAFSLS